MDSTNLKDKINNLSIWKKGDQRAPHKPLLILYALAQMQQKGKRLLLYSEVKDDLKNLLREFGPRRQSYHPEEPFVRLTNDGIWCLNVEVGSLRINNQWLANNGVVGGFNDQVYELLSRNKKLATEIAQSLLSEHFPETLHEDILTAIGLELEPNKFKVRDPKFREKVLRAYEYSCAICGFNVRLNNNLIAVEAAHIKWHQAGGPDCEENGIALCAMHHKLFDRGAFSLTDSKVLLVAEEANGTQGLQEWLMQYHGKPIRRPINPEYQPKESFIEWHVREVFRGPARYQCS